jgi:hypothetical protein
MRKDVISARAAMIADVFDPPGSLDAESLNNDGIKTGAILSKLHDAFGNGDISKNSHGALQVMGQDMTMDIQVHSSAPLQKHESFIINFCKSYVHARECMCACVQTH